MSLALGYSPGLASSRKERKIKLREGIKERRKMVWMEYCKTCKRKHYVTMQTCPTCEVYETSQPVSVRVYERCQADYDCDGCIAYRDHTNPY